MSIAFRQDSPKLNLAVFWAVLCCLASLTTGSFSPASAQMRTESEASRIYKYGRAVYERGLDGCVVNIQQASSGKFLRQVFGGAADNQRNVVVNGSDMGEGNLPSRGTGYDWVLRPGTSAGYFRIINLTTGLYLTKDNGTCPNVSNWGGDPSSSNEWWINHPEDPTLSEFPQVPVIPGALDIFFGGGRLAHAGKRRECRHLGQNRKP